MAKSQGHGREGPPSRSGAPAGFRRTLVLAAVILQSAGLSPTGGVPAARGEIPAHRPATFTVGGLGLEESLYWDGVSFAAESSSSCELAITCVDYWFSVDERGDRLRVGFDRNDLQDNVRMELFDCTAGSGCASRAATKPAYSAELFASRPARGMWRLRLTRVAPVLEPGRQFGDGAVPEAWRLRAKLEKLSATNVGRGELLLPNLVAEPPFEVSFRERATGGNCLPEETAENRRHVCLRVGFGPGNVGRGPLELRFGPLHREAGKLVGNMTQVVRHADPARAPLRHAAGRYEYHVAHQHFHWLGYAMIELFAVDGTRLVPRGTGRKLGFCLSDVKLTDWSSFTQEPANEDHVTETRRCLLPPVPDERLAGWLDEAQMRQTPGWTDIYDQTTPGNYINFSEAGGRPLQSGRYVIRTVVDPDDHALEENDGDNVGYTYIDVAMGTPITSSTVTILERGRGLDPWDPNKAVLSWNQPPTP